MLLYALLVVGILNLAVAALHLAWSRRMLMLSHALASQKPGEVVVPVADPVVAMERVADEAVIIAERMARLQAKMTKNKPSGQDKLNVAIEWGRERARDFRVELNDAKLRKLIELALSREEKRSLPGK